VSEHFGFDLAGQGPPDGPTHVPCCTAHGVPMTCERYRRTHFIEVRPCCAIDRERLMDVVDGTLDEPCQAPSYGADSPCVLPDKHPGRCLR
jgi:hypothetical protein